MASLLCCFNLSSKDKREEPEASPIMDNQNLGTNNFGGKMSILIPKNAKLPVRAESSFKTIKDYQTAVIVGVYEGDSSFTKDNIRIGGFTLYGLPSAPQGIANYKLCFEVDVKGTLKVSAIDAISSKLMKEIKITSDQRRSFKIFHARNKLLNYADSIMQTLGDARYNGKLNVSDKKKIMKLANKAIIWLNWNQKAKICEYESRLKELEALWNPVVTNLYQNAAGNNKVKPESCTTEVKPESSTPAPKTGGGLALLPDEVKPESCSSVPPKAGSVLDVD